MHLELRTQWKRLYVLPMSYLFTAIMYFGIFERPSGGTALTLEFGQQGASVRVILK